MTSSASDRMLWTIVACYKSYQPPWQSPEKDIL
jgi:hypothetical protein